jgi:hypothetical protein
MSKENKTIMRRALKEVVNKGNLDLLGLMQQLGVVPPPGG